MTKPGSLNNAAIRGFGKRAPAILPQETDQRLLAYALAAAGAVVLAPSASAEIVYTPVTVEIQPHSTFQIDLDHDGTTDFFLHHDEHSSISGNYRGGFLALGGSANAAVLARKLYLEPFALPKDFPIGKDSPKRFDPLGGQDALMANAFCYPLVPLDCQSNGAWVAATKKYLGLRFEINGEIHYGWARLTVTASFEPPLHMIRARLTGYAYETEPNKTILAGDRGLGPQASTGNGHPLDANLTTDRIQQFLTLGQLSLGSIGLDAWRQHKQSLEAASATKERH